MLSLRVFGGASIEGPEGPLTGRAAQRHRLALLALLAASPRGMTRDKLVGYLWPEKDAERARHALSDSVYRIHRALGEQTVVAAGDELRLDPESLPSDLAAFRESLDRGAWEAAIDTYGGPFLDGFHLPGAGEFERWVYGERQRLARQYAGALESLAEERTARGDLTGAAETWRRRAAHDRCDARVAMRLMEALEAAGNRAAALRHARIHAQLLEREFGTGPDPEVAALADRLRATREAEEHAGSELAADPSVGGGGKGSEGSSDAARPVERESGPEDGEHVRREADGPPSSEGSGVESPSPPGPLYHADALRRPALVTVALLAAAAGIWLAGLWERGADDPDPAASVAVLPFDNLSSIEENRYFVDGVTEEILTRLARIGDLRVIARASVVPYRDTDRSLPEIAEELSVSHVLQGSVRRSGDRVRITARLVDVAGNTQLWAESYDRQLKDVFGVQTDIATRVADALEGRLGSEASDRIEDAPTHDLEAYNLYLRGRYFWHRRTEEGLRESARLFQQAVQRDSGYARAWSGLADAYSVLAFYDYLPPHTAYPRAREAAQRALSIDETLASAHASLGYIALYYEWDAGRAEDEFRRAIELNPNYSVAHQWYANLLVATGRFEEAVREMSLARQVNPLSLIANGALGWVHYYAGRYAQAVRQCDRALEMDPDWDLGYLWRGLALEQAGRHGTSIRSLRRAVELSGGSAISVAALAHTLATAGRVREARGLLERLTEEEDGSRYRPSFEIAKVHLAMGEDRAALDWLERAYRERSHSMVFLEVDPQLAPLRTASRFRRLVNLVGLE